MKWSNRAFPADVNFIKIDTEGAEFRVINACDDLIHRSLPLIYAEVNWAALRKFNTIISDIDVKLSSLGYHFFRNTGSRNSANDTFKLARIKNLRDGGPFFDFLAVHPSNERYPQTRIIFNYFSLPKRIRRKMTRMVKRIYDSTRGR